MGIEIVELDLLFEGFDNYLGHIDAVEYERSIIWSRNYYLIPFSSSMNVLCLGELPWKRITDRSVTNIA